MPNTAHQSLETSVLSCFYPFLYIQYMKYISAPAQSAVSTAHRHLTVEVTSADRWCSQVDKLEQNNQLSKKSSLGYSPVGKWLHRIKKAESAPLGSLPTTVGKALQYTCIFCWTLNIFNSHNYVTLPVLLMHENPLHFLWEHTFNLNWVYCINFFIDYISSF